MQTVKFHTALVPVAIACSGILTAGDARAASHSDAPLIKQDPQANITDVYAFIGTKYNNPGQTVLNIVVSVRPFSEPGDGVIYDRFSDSALYSIHITDPATGATVTRYDFEFTPAHPTAPPFLKNADTILSYGLGTAAGPILNTGDERQNYTQFYTVRRTQGGPAEDVGSGVTAPPNVGARVTPLYNDSQTGTAVSGATTPAELDRYTQQAVGSGLHGEVFWAGPRDDGFYADTPAIFDLLDSRILDNNGSLNDGLGQDGGGVDGFKGFNVLTFGVQVPVANLITGTYSAPFFGTATGVGVYASVSRRRITLLKTNGDPVHSGPWVQVNRMGNPLFNEVLVALRDKDTYNRTSPENDAQFATYAENPEVARLINLILFGDPEGDGPLTTTGRADLTHIFIPDVLRVNTSTGPVRLPGMSGFSRLSFLGGDAATGPSGPAAGGWPNGRRIGDDVVDIALTAIASGPSYTTILLVGDNVAANDQLYNQVFPYLATPHAGPQNRKDPPCLLRSASQDSADLSHAASGSRR